MSGGDGIALVFRWAERPRGESLSRYREDDGCLCDGGEDGSEGDIVVGASRKRGSNGRDSTSIDTLLRGNDSDNLCPLPL